jgi:hypothetical protein
MSKRALTFAKEDVDLATNRGPSFNSLSKQRSKFAALFAQRVEAGAAVRRKIDIFFCES